MSNEIFFGKNSFRFWYYRYKDSAYYSISIIVLTIASCLYLIFQFIIPQFEQWFSIRNEIIATRQRTEIINSNIAYLNTLDKNLLNKQLQTSLQALPVEKNFGTILDSLNLAALRSGVSFQDYSFQVGNISTQSAQLSSAKIPGLSSVSLGVIINGTVDQVRLFLREMAKTLPISEVISIDGASGAVTVTFDFYQKNPPTTTLKNDEPIPHVSETNATILNQLTTWQGGSINNANSVGASSSGLPLF